MKQYACSRPLPMTNVIDHARGFYDKSKVELFDDALAQWHARHDLRYYNENGDSPFFNYVQRYYTDSNSTKAVITWATTNFIKRDDLPGYWSYAHEMANYFDDWDEGRAVVTKCWDEGPRPQVTAPINLKIWK
eukprot:1008933_1